MLFCVCRFCLVFLEGGCSFDAGILLGKPPMDLVFCVFCFFGLFEKAPREHLIWVKRFTCKAPIYLTRGWNLYLLGLALKK